MPATKTEPDAVLLFSVYTRSFTPIDEIAQRFFRVALVEEPADDDWNDECDDECEYAPATKSKPVSNVFSINGGIPLPAPSSVSYDVPEGAEAPAEASTDAPDQYPAHYLYKSIPLEVFNGKTLSCRMAHETDIRQFVDAQYSLWPVSMRIMECIVREGKRAGIPIGHAVEQVLDGKNCLQPKLVADTSLYTLLEHDADIMVRYPTLPWEALHWSKGKPHFLTSSETPLHLSLDDSCGMDQAGYAREVVQLMSRMSVMSGGIISVGYEYKNGIKGAALKPLETTVQETMHQHLGME